MIVIAYYIESVTPANMEDIKESIEFLKGNIPFRAKVLDQEVKSVELALRIKQEEYTAMIKPLVKLPFKKGDKVLLFDKALRVVNIHDHIPSKHSLRASRSKELYERYVERTVVLK